MGAICDTPTRGVVIDVDDPEAAAGLESDCDVLLCLYVIELTAGVEEALRIHLAP